MRSHLMRLSTPWLAAILAFGAIAASLAAAGDGDPSLATPHRPELEYLEAVNRAGPPQDPQLLFLLMGQYANANLHREGAEHLSALLKEFGPRLSDAQKSLYLSAIGALRAGYAGKVFLLRRYGWVKDTITILEEAREKSGGNIYVVRWISGVVYAQLPDTFGKRQSAKDDLNWCLRHMDKAPHPGWAREVYFSLARLAKEDGDESKAREWLRLSGFPDFDKPVTVTAPNSIESATGHAFSARRVTEVVPKKIYELSGFEFTEYYFVVSEDGQELIGIDAGTRPDSAEAAYSALRAYAPGLPQLTTIFVTHAHWDHVGGHRYFRSLNPRLKFYARADYREEISRSAGAPQAFAKRFFGERFELNDVTSFKPDVTLDRATELKIGGTRVEVIPVQGGETDDALFVHLPDNGTLFVGDFIMPFLGAPFVEEGNLPGLLDAIDVVARLKPRHLLHGHEPLNRIFPTPAVLAAMQSHLAWLRAEVLAAIRRGSDRSTIQQANLIPPGLLAGEPGAQLPYLVMRENVINRVFHQAVGYWQPDLQGMDILGRSDRGSMLVDYLGVTESRLSQGVERMIADGKYELAASALDWARGRYPDSARLESFERLAYLKLMEKYQEFNPFKLIVYSGKGGLDLPQLDPATATTVAIGMSK
jgi:glyoxylase-like metal-dependent hydrolase (beta-lactamase superfamily II)